MALAFWLRMGVPATVATKFILAWAATILIPGVVFLKATWPNERSWSGDLALGAATGIAVQLAIWFVAAKFGHGNAAPVIVVLVACALVAHPVSRRRIADGRWTTPSALERWTMAVVTWYSLVRVAAGMRAAPLPPVAASQYVDTYWHLAFVHAVSHGRLPEVPQFFGHPLHYHYFAHAHMALVSRVSGIEPEIVLLRLWVFPLVLVVVYSIGWLTTTLTAYRAAPAIAAGLATIGTPLSPINTTMPLVSVIYPESPSQVLVAALAPAIGCGFVAVCRGQVRGSVIAWLAAVLAGSFGAKSALIPVLLSGTIIATLVALLTNQRKQAQQLVGWLAYLAALVVVSVAVVGGTTGGKVSILATLNSLSPYAELVQHNQVRAMDTGYFVDSLVSPRAWFLGALTLFVWLLGQSPRLVGVVGALRRDGPGHVAGWWLAGAGIGGYLAMFVVDHDGFSQAYFPLASLSFLSVLSSIAFVRAWKNDATRTLVATACIVGVALALAMAGTRSVSVVSADVGLAGATVLSVALIVASAALLAIRSGAPTKDRFGIALVALVVGLSLPTTVRQLAGSLRLIARPAQASASTTSSTFVSTKEQQAMLWLRNHADADDRLVTNLHCIPPRNEPDCDARGFWVVGLSGVPAALEGYGYTSESQSRQGVGDLRGVNQPPPRSAAADLSRQLFQTPNDATVRILRDDHGVDWVVGVARAGATAKLADLGELRAVFNNGEVVIFSTR